MGKIAFVFSGQGDQFPGMGKDLYDKYPEAKKVFDIFDTLRPSTSSQCFSGTSEELMETKNTQPCLYAVELAGAEVLAGRGIKPDAVAGFSLGEVAAAAAGGLFDYETGFRLVCRRGELMQAVSEKFETSMAAVLKLTEEEVVNLCSAYSNVYPVNFNCPGQISVAGLSSEMAPFMEDVKKAGGRAVPLKVKGGFHSPFMKEASVQFAEELKKTDMKEPAVPLFSDLTAERYSGDPVKLLSEQISNPVRWEKLIRTMIAEGVDTFIEIGPGKTLTNMIRKIDANVRSTSVSEYLAEVE